MTDFLISFLLSAAAFFVGVMLFIVAPVFAIRLIMKIWEMKIKKILKGVDLD